MAEFISVVKAGTSDTFVVNASHIQIITADIPVGGKPTTRILFTPPSAIANLQVYGDLKTILKNLRSRK